MIRKLYVRGSLPHNFLAEKMLLSCLLIEPDLVETVTSQLSVDAFYFKNHRELYKVLSYMTKSKLPINPLKLASFLQTQGLLHKIGGTKILLELITQIPNLMCFEEYIQVINEKFLRRSLIRIGYKTISSSYIVNISSENILKDLEAELFSLTTQTVSSKLPSSAQLLENIFLELKKKFLNPQLPGLTSGFKNLDSITQGFQRSDLIVIAGRPSMGKTALSLTIALNIIKYSRLPVLFFSLEMSKEQIMYRILAMESNIDPKKLKTGKLQKNDWVTLHRLIKIFSRLPLFIDDSPTSSIQKLRFKIKTIIAEQEKLGLVIVDYLQLMQNLSKQSGTRTEELSQITRALKNLAREFNIPIIFLSQLSRNVETRLNQTPILSDLRESGSIEQDADLVLMLSNVEFSKSSSTNNKLSTDSGKMVDIVVAKHRNGPTGKVRLEFRKRQAKFFEIPNE